jgi:hypothetical protein
VPDVRLSGHPTRRLPGTCNICFRHVESESIVLGLDLKGIGVSAGSACTSGNVEPSYVLVAMGVPVEWAMGAVRHSLGRVVEARFQAYGCGPTIAAASAATEVAAGTSLADLLEMPAGRVEAAVGGLPEARRHAALVAALAARAAARDALSRWTRGATGMFERMRRT